MANPEHLAILKQGIAAWNVWKTRTTDKVDLSRLNLTGAYLYRANLESVNFSGTNLSGAHLDATDLTNAILSEADLSGADFSGANLSFSILLKADLKRANLSGANLRGAKLSGADLTTARLIGANISRANLADTNLTYVELGYGAFDDVDLRTTKGLATVIHKGPTTIGIDTLYKSKGRIPETFLRGCGVPDSFIAQAKALIGAEEGIQFYSCFISYSTNDEEFARRLHARLQQEHIRVWFAPDDMKSGEKVHEQIDTAIKVYDKLLILLSPGSLESNWVMTELRKARKEERKTGQRKLFPVGLTDFKTLKDWECFDSDTGTDLAVEVREYFIPDFTHWKDHDAFEFSFARLLKDLRQSTQSAPRP